MTVQTIIDDYAGQTLPNSVSPVLTAEMVQAVYDANNKAHFMVVSSQAITLSTDSSNPSFLTSLAYECPCSWFSVVESLGAVKNDSGRSLTMTGAVSYHARNNNAANREVRIFSQTSIDDGVTWSENDNSGREESVRGTSAKYSTKSSEVIDLPAGALLRFGFWSDSGVSLLPVDFLVNGNTVNGPSFRWTLREN